MAVISSSVEIGQPAEAVFAFLTNLENQKALQPGIKSVTLNGPVAVGTRYIIQGQIMGSNFSSESEIVAFEPGKKFAIKTLAPPPASPVTTTYLLEASGSGTKLTTQMDTVITGGFPGVEEMVKKQLQATLDGTSAALKKAIEG